MTLHKRHIKTIQSNLNRWVCYANTGIVRMAPGPAVEAGRMSDKLAAEPRELLCCMEARSVWLRHRTVPEEVGGRGDKVAVGLGRMRPGEVGRSR
jgi:hypothetical protein